MFRHRAHVLLLLSIAGCSSPPSAVQGDASAPEDVDRDTPDATHSSETGDAATPTDGDASTSEATLDDAACTPLGSFCDPGGCCEGACDVHTGLCSSGEGGFCDPTKANPDAYCAFGLVCDTSTSRCVKMTCVPDSKAGICNEFSVPCCDPETKCTMIDLVSGPVGACCAPDGTMVSASWKCCSAAIETLDGGLVRCVAKP